MSLSEGLQLVQVDDNHGMGVWGEFMIAVWRRRTELAAVQTLRRRLAELGSLFPAGTATISVIEPTAVPPETEVRKELALVLTTPRLKCSSLVYEGTGFQAATVRGVVTAITLLRSHPVPHVVHASVKEGVQWSLQMLGGVRPASSMAGLVFAVEALRGRIVPSAVNA